MTQDEKWIVRYIEVMTFVRPISGIRQGIELRA